MEITGVPADRRRKKRIRTAFLLLLGVLLFFTFFSNTLESLMLPKVTTVQPESRSLEFTLEGSGMLRPVSEVQLLNSSGWKVRQILVKEGDKVKKGQQLILYDSQTAESELQDEVSLLDKQKILQQTLQDQFIQTYLEGDELQIRKARREIEAGKLDQATQARKIAGMRDQLARQQQLLAPFDGIVTQVNAIPGMLSAGAPDLVLSSSSEGYQFDFMADAELLSSLGVSLGEKIEVEVHPSEGQQARPLQGQVAEIKTVQARTGSSSGEENGRAEEIPQRNVFIRLAEDSLKGGEQVQVKLKKPSLQEGLVVPDKAIHQAGERSFVYKIEEQRGALGNNFVVREVQIRSSITNGVDSLIQTDTLYEDELIILESSEPLQDGNRVRLQ
ncbi:biotin/lipoyl-binding protein [Paenibacillus tritici]|uniref:efflux RND transporter periplasmic adaptor subunit n=1 Tax=Paenibacillus tritici TaxID=1873425 RepID=UPI001BAD97E2|nr:biotin/lipoyl-binding protein [Paenibacillus tritici]QUL54878.1 biotin/lipoyl-binding protein [Paenibacillus tritici]